MATSHYFQSGVPGGRSSEQLLIEDLIIECMKIYGFDTYYLPRKTVYEDGILNEDALNKYDDAYALEMYMQNVTGFEGDGDLLTKFGVEIKLELSVFIILLPSKNNVFDLSKILILNSFELRLFVILK